MYGISRRKKIGMFGIIFGTASFTTLIVSWTMLILFTKETEKSRELATKKGICYTCGALLPKKHGTKKKSQLGFKH